MLNKRGNSYLISGFTLIELLVVVGMIAIISSIGIPAAFKALQKRDPLTQGVNDVLEACAQARAMAIIGGTRDQNVSAIRKTS